MTRHTFGARGVVCLTAAACLGVASLARAASLDEQGEIRLGARVYGGVRVGSEHTDKDIDFLRDASGNVVEESVFDADLNQFITVPKQRKRTLTFPVSGAGHVRQERYFAEVELDHDLTRLWREGFGPFALLNKLPFEMKKFRYHITYRGEGDEVYNIGPSEYRTADQYFDDTIPNYPDRVLIPPYTSSGLVVSKVNVGAERRRLRRVAQDRQRLFQAFLETETGDLNMRFGRQILVWGEADAFRLLDNINPIDNGFGGFLVSLDERRVPLDMLILNYYLDDLWGVAPFYGAYVEFFGAIDSHVAFDPGIPVGSPWALPNLGDPSASLITFRENKDRTFKDARFGFLTNTHFAIPNFSDLRLQFAHYYTYFDTPAVEILTSRFFPTRFDESQGAPPGTQGAIAIAEQTAPLVQVTGGSASFGIPATVARMVGLSGEPQIRTEVAYFANEPRFTQANIDPFIFAVGGCNDRGIKVGGDSPPLGGIGCSGGRDTGTSWNFVLGIDHNQYIRFLNPNQSFFITTQFFYRHLNGAQKRRGITTTTGCNPDTQLGCVVSDGEVLPVPELEISPEAQFSNVGAVEPILVRHPVDQYLQTLLIFTSYYSGQINPSLTLFYDWSGGVTVIPQVTFSRDPFRFTMSYSFLDASRLKGGSGVSLLRDRDNFLFQLEYVI